MAERIEFVFKGDASDLQAALKGVTGDLQAMEGGAEKATGAAKKGLIAMPGPAKVAALAVAGVTAAFAAAGAAAVKMAKDTLKLSAHLNRVAKEAKEAGTTAEEFQKLEGALGLLTKGGVSAANTAKFLGRNLAEARDGAGPAKDALDKLGLSAEHLAGLPLTEQIAAIGDAMPGLRDHSERTQVALDLLGRSGSALLPAFEEGGAGVRAAVAEIEEAGVVSNESARAAEVLEDRVALLHAQFQNLKDRSLAPLIPIFAQVTEAVRILIRDELGGGIATIEAAAKAIGENLAVGLGEAAFFIKNLLDGVHALMPFLQALADGRIGPSDFGALKEGVKRLKNFKQAMRDNLNEAGALTAGIVKLREEMRLDPVGGVSRGGGSSPAASAPSAAVGAVVEDGDFGSQLTAIEAFLDGKERFESAQHQRTIERIGQEGVAREQQASQALGAFNQVASAIGGISSELTNAMLADVDREGEGRKQAALKAFRINKANALVQAGISTALAVANAATTVPFVPAGIAAMAAAGIAGTIAIGTIAAKQPPKFHRGGMVRDEVTARLRSKEAVLNPGAVAKMGGPDVIAQINRDPSGMAGGQQVNVIKIGSQVFDVQTHQAVGRFDSPMASALRATQPRSLGRRSPFAARRS